MCSTKIIIVCGVSKESKSASSDFKKQKLLLVPKKQKDVASHICEAIDMLRIADPMLGE